MRAKWIVALVLVCQPPPRAWAQRVEVGLLLGHELNAHGAFTRSEVQPGTGTTLRAYDSRHDPGLVLGLSVAYWPSTLLGIEWCPSLWSGWRTLNVSGAGGAPVETVRTRDSVVSHAIRVVVRLGASERVDVRLALGPELLFPSLQYYRYYSDASPKSGPLVGASAASAVLYRLSATLSLRVAVDASWYRIGLEPLPPDAWPTSTPRQIAVSASVGAVLRVHE